MPEIYSFRIDNARAEIGKNGLIVTLTYPNNPSVEEKRIPENLDRDIEVFSNLINRGYSDIAPIRPASSGSLSMFADGKVLVNRRDKGAPTRPLYHSAYAGFAATREHVYTAEGLLGNGLRESAEEALLITRDKKPWLIAPKDSREYVLESARKLEIDLSVRELDVSILEPTDKLVVVDESGNLVFEARAFLEFIYESQTSLNALQIRELSLRSDEVLPIDAEGMHKDGRFVHFNRESYIIDPKDIAGMGFGFPIASPSVYRTDFVQSGASRMPVPALQTDKNYGKPYLGPDKVEVVHPHIWAPEDLLRRALDAIGVEGYAGRWMELELWIERFKKEGKSILPDEVVVKK